MASTTNQSQFFEKELGLSGSDLTDACEIDALLSSLNLSQSPFAKHPFAFLISAGSESLPILWNSYLQARGVDESEALAALDAIACILMSGGNEEYIEVRVRTELKDTKAINLAAALAKCLALCGDDELMREQVTLLAHDDPAISAMAAQLLGYGRYQPALPALHAMISPQFFLQSKAVIWAVGQIGSLDSLKVLSNCAQSGFRTTACLEAMGKIGSLLALPSLIGFILQGSAEETKAALGSLAQVLHENRDEGETLQLVRKEIAPILVQMLDTASFSKEARISMLICLSRLGVTLERQNFSRYLGLSLSTTQVDQVASYFMNRKH